MMNAQRKGMHPIAAGLIGAAAAAAAVALTDERNREKVTSALTDLKKRSKGIIENASKNVPWSASGEDGTPKKKATKSKKA